MVSRQPPRIQKYDLLATARWNAFTDVKNVALGIGGVHTQPDGSGIGNISRSGDRCRHRQGLRPRGLSPTGAAEQRQSGISYTQNLFSFASLHKGEALLGWIPQQPARSYTQPYFAMNFFLKVSS